MLTMFYCTGSLMSTYKSSLRGFLIANNNLKIFIPGKRLTSQFTQSQCTLHCSVDEVQTVAKPQCTSNWDIPSKFKFYRGFKLWLGLTAGLGVGSLYGYGCTSQSLINNESAIITTNDNIKLRMKEDEYQLDRNVVSAEESHKRRKIIYKQMCLGSILGIGFGLVMIKISSTLIYLTVFSMLVLEWLRNRGIIDLRGNQLIRLGTSQSKSILKRIKIQEMNMFKISFLSTLLLTCINY